MYAAVRIRGSVNVRADLEEALHRLRLERPNNCVLLPETPAHLGMLRKVKDLIAYGRVDAATVTSLLRKRGRLKGEGRLTDETVRELGYGSLQEFAQALADGKTAFRDIPQLSSVLRLRPPSGGHKTVKRPYPEGSLGDWGSDINQLLIRMA